MPMADAPARPVAKDAPYRSESWRRAVASLPCAECGKDAPSQAAHINHLGKGMGIKPSDAYTVPLCPTCHTEYDQGKAYSRAERHEKGVHWLIATFHQLATKGLIRA